MGSCWLASTIRSHRKQAIHLFSQTSFRSFASEIDSENGRGEATSRQETQSAIAPGSQTPSRPSPVQGRGRKSRLVEEWGIKFDPVKEEEKLRVYVPDENPHRARYENVEVPETKESKIRVVQALETEESEHKLDFQKLEETEKKRVVKAESEEESRLDLTERVCLTSPEEGSWMEELQPLKAKAPEVQWLDELRPGTKLTPSAIVNKTTTLSDTRIDHAMENSTEAVSLQKKDHLPPVHKAYQEQEEGEIEAITVSGTTSEAAEAQQTISESASKEEQGMHAAETQSKQVEVQEIIDEFVVADRSTDSGKVLVQFEDEELVEADQEAKEVDDDDDSSDEDNGQPLKLHNSEDLTHLEREEKILKEKETKVDEPSGLDAFDRFVENLNDQKNLMSDSKMDSGGLASVIQRLLKKDREAPEATSSSTESFMEDLGWMSSPDSSVSQATEREQNLQQKLEAPLRSALAERLGWTASQDSTMIEDIAIVEMDGVMERQQEDRQRIFRSRMMDSYGRMKVRTPEERRLRAMRSGKAMEMALEGKLDQFDPDSYVEPEMPDPLPRSTSGRMRGSRFRGRGRGRSSFGQAVPNLFQQRPIEMEPRVQAAPHVESDYYHDDVMSKLGIKFTQHQLMNIERHIQSLASSSFNFNVGQPTPWEKVKISSPDRFLEENKPNVRQVMNACGFTFSEKNWRTIKQNSYRDFQEYKACETARYKGNGSGPFKNVKQEEAALFHLMKTSLSEEDPVYGHMKTVLPMLLANPSWTYTKKKRFIEFASDFSKELNG